MSLFFHLILLFSGLATIFHGRVEAAATPQHSYYDEDEYGGTFSQRRALADNGGSSKDKVIFGPDLDNVEERYNRRDNGLHEPGGAIAYMGASTYNVNGGKGKGKSSKSSSRRSRCPPNRNGKDGKGKGGSYYYDQRRLGATAKAKMIDSIAEGDESDTYKYVRASSRSGVGMKMDTRAAYLAGKGKGKGKGTSEDEGKGKGKGEGYSEDVDDECIEDDDPESSGPSSVPSREPTRSSAPTPIASNSPSTAPTQSVAPSVIPSNIPSTIPSLNPTVSSIPSAIPSVAPSQSQEPSVSPSIQPSTSSSPSSSPSSNPSESPRPSSEPSSQPSSEPSKSSEPSTTPSFSPSSQPSSHPSAGPSGTVSAEPSSDPSSRPSFSPSSHPSTRPSSTPSVEPSSDPSTYPSFGPSSEPSIKPSSAGRCTFQGAPLNQYFSPSCCETYDPNGYQICLEFLNIRDVDIPVLDNAVARWEAIITKTTRDSYQEEVSDDGFSRSCNDNGKSSFYSVNNQYRGIWICGTYRSLDDGIIGIGGFQSPVFNRVTVTQFGFIGIDVKDNDDTVPVSGDLILHEIGHALGIGTMWERPDGRLVKDNDPPPNIDYCIYEGENAIAQFQDLSGYSSADDATRQECDDAGVDKPRVQRYNIGGTDRCGGHWQESCLNTELMTPVASTNALNPLSILTVGSLVDLGYTVNYNPADTMGLFILPQCQCPPTVGRRTQQGGDDILSGPSSQGILRAEAFGRSLVGPPDRAPPAGLAVAVFFTENGLIYDHIVASDQPSLIDDFDFD